jgi:glycosyltransferase involved in cell wall biosynthesis
MRIAQFIDTNNIGGAETMLLRLSLGLKKRGEEVIVFHFGNHYLEQECAEAKIKTVLIPFHKDYKSIFTVPIFSIKFARLLKNHQIDILHSHLYGPVTGASLGAMLYKIPHVGTMHDIYLVKERIGRNWILKAAQSSGTQLVTVSANMQNFYQNFIPFGKEIQLIYNGFTWDESLPSKKQNTNNPPLLMITVARLIKLKGHCDQIKALTNILLNYHIKLLIVGEGPERKNIEKTIKENNLEEKVTLLGERSDIGALLSQADLFLLNSDSEGLSCSILEAMSAALPCIISDVGGNSELVKNGKNGYIYSRNDNIKYRELILELIIDKEKRTQMGRASQKLANEVFNINNMVDKYLNAYNKVCKKA